jgi:hypothetical protein
LLCQILPLIIIKFHNCYVNYPDHAEAWQMMRLTTLSQETESSHHHIENFKNNITKIWHQLAGILWKGMSIVFIHITKAIGTSNIRSSICEQYKFVVIILVRKHASVVTSGVTLWILVFVEIQCQYDLYTCSSVNTRHVWSWCWPPRRWFMSVV